jgi:hypothetical protein
VYLDNPLHRARLASGLDLAELAGRTYLSPRIVQQIDDGCFEELPGGVYARSYVRAFATAVGLEPEETLERLSDQLPPVQDPLPVLREIARRQTPAWVVMIEEGRTVLASAAAGIDHLPWRPDGWRQPFARIAAAGFDTILLLLLLISLVRLTAWTVDLSVPDLVDRAGRQLFAFWGVMVAIYYVMFGGIGGQTLGASVCGLPSVNGPPSLRLKAILARALRSAGY